MEIQVEHYRWAPEELSNIRCRMRIVRILIPIPDDFFDNVHRTTLREHKAAAVTSGGSIQIATDDWKNFRYGYRHNHVGD